MVGVEIAQRGVELEHGGEDMDVGVRGGVEDETGVGWRCTEARALVDEE